MIDEDGEEWLPAIQAAARLKVQPGTVRSWVSRGQVRGHLIGGRSWVSMEDATTAEHGSRQLRRIRTTTRGSSTP